MSVYLGTFGEVELRREFDGTNLSATIASGDINASSKRFSFVFDFDQRQLISGDQIEITSDNGSSLAFISGYTQSSIKKFIHVDEIGGIRLYNSFSHSVVGGVANAIALADFSGSIDVKIVVENTDFSVLARVQNYELNTQRDTVDVTALSDQFKNNIAGLISGSGRMACEWEYTGDTVKELPNYLLELLLRTKVGSTFRARFYIKTANYNPANHASGSDDAIWYEFEGVLTACAVQFTPAQIVQITADFITTSEIQLRMDLDVRDEILQENSDNVLLEQGSGAKLNLEQV